MPNFWPAVRAYLENRPNSSKSAIVLPAVVGLPCDNTTKTTRIYDDPIFRGWVSDPSALRNYSIVTLYDSTKKGTTGGLLDSMKELCSMPEAPIGITADVVIRDFQDVEDFLHSIVRWFEHTQNIGISPAQKVKIQAILAKLGILGRNPELERCGIVVTTINFLLKRLRELNTHAAVNRKLINAELKASIEKAKACDSDVGLLLHHSDVPGRISGLTLLAPNQQNGFDSTWCPIIEPAGLITFDLFNRVQTVQTETASEIFIFADPLTAVMFHEYSMRLIAARVPLVAYHPDAIIGTSMKQAFRDAETFIFWSPELTPRVVRNAIDWNGRIATNEIIGEDPRQGFRRKWPLEWLNKMKSVAMSWEAALEKHIRYLPDNEFNEFLSAIGFNCSEFRNFKALCHPAVAARLMIADGSKITRSVKINRRLVAESGKGWLSGDEIISNAVLKLYTITKAGDRTFYSGAVLFDGQQVRFDTTDEKIEKHTFKFMYNLLLSAGLGPMVYNQHWSAHALSLANQFSNPEVITTHLRIGWDDCSHELRFPGFSIHQKNAPVVYNANLVCIQGRPGRSQRPSRGDETFVRLFGQLHDRDDALTMESLATDIIGAIAANIMAPASNEKPTGIALSGRAAHYIGDLVAKAFDCLYADVYSTNKLRAAELEHGWPVVLSRPINKFHGQLVDWAKNSLPHNCIIKTNQLAGLSCVLNDGWVLIHDDTEPLHVELSYSAACYLLSGFIQDALADTIKTVARNDYVAGQYVAQELRHWLRKKKWYENIYTDPEHTGIRLLDNQHRFCAGGKLIRAKEALTQLLRNLFFDGHLRIHPEKYSGPGSKHMDIVHVKTHRSLNAFVSSRRINDLLSEVTGITIDLTPDRWKCPSTYISDIIHIGTYPFEDPKGIEGIWVNEHLFED